VVEGLHNYRVGTKYLPPGARGEGAARDLHRPRKRGGWAARCRAPGCRTTKPKNRVKGPWMTRGPTSIF